MTRKEINRVLRGEMVDAARGYFVEWQTRMSWALDPLIQPHVGRGGYLGLRYVIGKEIPTDFTNFIGTEVEELYRRGFRRGFADFFGTPGGLLSDIPLEITTVKGLAEHLNRTYLDNALIFTYQ